MEVRFSQTCKRWNDMGECPDEDLCEHPHACASCGVWGHYVWGRAPHESRCEAVEEHARARADAWLESQRSGP
eukprot:9202478-Alexandrium_andersonii.AAC.1